MTIELPPITLLFGAAAFVVVVGVVGLVIGFFWVSVQAAIQDLIPHEARRVIAIIIAACLMLLAFYLGGYF